MAVHYGTLQEFRPEVEELTTYLERVDLFFTANETPEAKQVPIFLNVVGATTYSLLRSLLAPANPKDKSLADLAAVLKGHFEPKRNVVAERFRFHKRCQNQGESVASFVAELRRLAARCSFGNHLDEALRDRIVCGLSSEAVRKRLLTEKDLNLAKTIEIAQSMETAQKDALALQTSVSELTVGAISRPRESPNRPNTDAPCHRCGKSGHWARACSHRSTVCHKCGKTGHLARVCRGGVRRQRESQANLVGLDGTPDSNEDLPHGADVINRVNKVGSPAASPYKVTLELNGKPLEMEVDTGAAVSIISELTKKTMFPTATLSKTPVTLRTYSADPLTVLGKLSVEVKYRDYVGTHSLFVVEGKGSNLLGRDWLTAIRLDWASIKAVALGRPAAMEGLISEYAEVFTPGTGTMRHVTAQLCLKEGAQPRFFRPRSVPYSLKERVGKELDRLEEAGVLRKTSHADWAAPIVPVVKKDGSIRICGDYKVTINPSLCIDQYPLPKPSDLMSCLTGGQKFSKLDLSAAYQQVTLDEASSKMVVVNTHQGLYQYTRLPFGVASAPAIFQKTMDGILQGIPFCICYLDDILVTGRSDEEHVRNLRTVLQRLQEHGVRLRQDKCTFFQESVEYLGHTISAGGVHTTDQKVKAVVDAPSPRDVSELRSFLGLLNYYSKFLPNLASTLHPLHVLLREGQRWNWSKQCQLAFEAAKKALVQAPLLVHYDPTLPMSLAGDASAYGIGAVISHKMADGTERPIAFASRTLSASEKNYSQVEKEALSLIFGIRKFHQYLYGRHFTLITDHKPLTTILGPKQGIPQVAAARMQRWALLLSAYSYSIQFRSTHAHCNADGLSRLPLPAETAVGNPEDSTVVNLMQISFVPVLASDVAIATRKDPVLSKVLVYLRQGWPDEIPEGLQAYFHKRHELSIEGDTILWGMRVVVPSKWRKTVLHELHQGHQGIVRLKQLARSHVWWPKIDQDLEDTVNDCAPCQEHRNTPPKSPLNPWSWPEVPWERIHVDFAGPVKGQMLFVVVDSHSKWPEVCIMNKTSSGQTITALREMFARNGLPRELVSDNGPQFTSQEFLQFMTTNGIRHITSSPYHPASNGAAERFVQTVKRALYTGGMDGTPLEKTLTSFLLQYRNTSHPTTGVSPSSLFLHRVLRTRLDLLRPDVGSRVRKHQSQQKMYHDQRSRHYTFDVNEHVWVRNFRDGPRWKKGVVAACVGPVSYVVRMPTGALWRRHCDHIRRGTAQAVVSQGDSTDHFSFSACSPSPPSADGNNRGQPLSSSAVTDTTCSEELSMPEHSTGPPTATARLYPQRSRRPPDRLYGTLDT